MEEENNPLWPWIVGFIAYRSYRNRKNRFYTENFYEDEIFDDYFEEE